MTKRIRIRLFPDGHIEADVEGIKGKGCTDYIKILEQILEAETVDSAYTHEYYENELITQEITQFQKLD